jgi:hypothetical protein
VPRRPRFDNPLVECGRRRVASLPPGYIKSFYVLRSTTPNHGNNSRARDARASTLPRAGCGTSAGVAASRLCRPSIESLCSCAARRASVPRTVVLETPALSQPRRVECGRRRDCCLSSAAFTARSARLIWSAGRVRMNPIQRGRQCRPRNVRVGEHADDVGTRRVASRTRIALAEGCGGRRDQRQ